MSYYKRGGGRRYNPAAEERREREKRDQERIERDKKRLHRLLSQYKRVKLKGAESQRAWGMPERRSFTVGKTYNGDRIISTIRGEGRELFLQVSGGMGWDFYRLIPRYHTLRREEEEDGRDPARRRSRRDPPRKAFGTSAAGWTAIEGWEITHGSNVHGGSYRWIVRTHKEKAEAIETLDRTGEWYRIREIPKRRAGYR